MHEVLFLVLVVVDVQESVRQFVLICVVVTLHLHLIPRHLLHFHLHHQDHLAWMDLWVYLDQWDQTDPKDLWVILDLLDHPELQGSPVPQQDHLDVMDHLEYQVLLAIKDLLVIQV